MALKTYLTIQGLSKAYGNQVLFEDAHITIHENQKIGLIGRNGAGKTTLMKIITGEDEADAGDIIFHPGVSIGYLRQQDEFNEGETIIDYLVRASGKEEWQCGKAAYRFELTKDWLYLPIESLSGGYQMRVKLAAMVAREPNLILLDEPTNYLDLATVILLEQFIREFRGSVIVISHDREFLKRTCDHTMEVEHGAITLFPRSLEEYLSHKEVSREVMERFNEKVLKQKEHLQKFVDRFGAKASKASQAQSKMKMIAKLDKNKKKNPLPTVDINIRKIEQTKGVAIRINNMSIGYKDVTIAKGLNIEIDKGEHVVILGNNGQGKSTLMKTISNMILPTSGAYRWTPMLQIAYFGQQSTDSMNPVDTVLLHLRKSAGSGVGHEDIMRMAGNFLFRDDDLEKKINVLSGGEKARLALAAMLLTKNDVILLDEPTNHLDFPTAEALAFALAGSNRTVIFISHDRTFVSIVAERLIEIRDGQMPEYIGSYQDYVDELVTSAAQLDRTAQKPKPRIKEAEEAQDNQKELKEKLRNLEVEIADLQKEKAKLLRQFEQSAGEFNLARTERFKATEDLIKQKEAEWLEVQTDIES